jgi:hypothetical protein
MTREGVEAVISVNLRETLRECVPVTYEPFMTIIIEYKHPETGEIITIRESK